MRTLLGCLGLAMLLGAGRAEESSWSRLTGCRWMENESNDGDSFHVQYQGREYIFRLYFVDCCETDQQIPERVRQQAEFLKIPTARVLQAGQAARAFSHGLLARQPFTVVTKWEDAKGASHLPRHYAFVLFGENDRTDLASTLAQNGLVRIFGMPADPPGSVTGAQFQSHLLKFDAQARSRHLGIFGDLTPTASSGDASAAGGDAPALLPADAHPADVVDDPAGDRISNFAIQVAEQPAITEITMPEDDYSEIPGWKPKASPTPAAAPSP